jgi:hypothetical protein
MDFTLGSHVPPRKRKAGLGINRDRCRYLRLCARVVSSLDRKCLGTKRLDGAGISIRGVFDEETRRKLLAFPAGAVRYGIRTAAWMSTELGESRECRPGA